MHYGADYNPDQWPEDIWPDDIARMREAGVTLVNLGIFSWARLQPEEDRFDFAWLDRILDLLHEGGIAVDLATPTASPPPWVSAKYPEILPQDERGATYWPGARQHYAPSSPVYRRLAATVAAALADRYADHPAVVMWHVNNEYGCHVHADYSDAARDAFRRWLTDRYGSIESLNAAWGTDVWSQRYGSFDEIVPPRLAPCSRNPHQLLDFRRFTSDMLLECFLLERDVLRAHGATQPITTNFMGAFTPADYNRWAEHLDVLSDDCYPDPNDPESFRDAAFQRDLMRSLKPGAAWYLMEQSTGAVNWRHANAPKAPGQMAALSAQAVGRGADGILFFQWRQSVSGPERLHSAMLPHAGTDTRSWREVVALGADLAALPPLPPPDERDGRVALVFDWENWWGVEGLDHPHNGIDYYAEMHRWYRALHRRHVQVDIVPPERVDDRYALAVAPLLYLLRPAGAAALERYVAGGGHLLTGPFSDVVDEHDRLCPGGYLTRLGPVVGIRLEDFGALVPVDAVGPGEREALVKAPWGGFRGTVHAEEIEALGASVEARFTTGRRRGHAAVTRNTHGRGVARYLATLPDEPGVQTVVDAALADAAVEPTLPGLPEHVEVARRGSMLTLVNHGGPVAEIALSGRDVLTGEEVSAARLAAWDWRMLWEDTATPR
ncbi:beta-galactosidase [Microbacterium sp. 179-I 3D2 NHS]|uniref:beta-galactosidase n=1 Tax=Microbacterium sp. 179-I 3D2 NHS TaxID=3235178 RepID=UPI0039A3E730